MIKTKSIASDIEIERRKAFFEQYKNNPIPEKEQLSNVGLFLKRQELSKILFLDEIYRQILEVHGIIFEFGVRWGQNLTTLNNLRGIYEPYNYSRKLIGFDTFEGFPSVDEKDGNHEIIQKGGFSVTENYEASLAKILDYHQSECPLNHINKNFLVKGDASVELEKYLKSHPETLIAFAYFDFDIYEPTKKCLELVLPLMPKGAIIGFDELTDPQFPGETVAFKEILKVRDCRLKRSRYGAIQSYIVLD
ncbi:MAG: crotonobetainyl-CoA--carnitine CoA-transferase [Luteibaculaceae bacterium]